MEKTGEREKTGLTGEETIQASSWSEGPAAHQGLEEDRRERKMRRRRRREQRENKSVKGGGSHTSNPLN